MPKKTIIAMRTVIVFLILVLFLGCFSPVLRIAGGETTYQSMQATGSASAIASLENIIEANGGWNSSLQTIYDGIVLGKTTIVQLQNAVDAINITSTSAAENVFYWYFEMSKLGVVINATTIEAALNEVEMLPNIGLPDDYDNTNTGSNIASFLLYNRYDLYAYQWADQLSYETSKWNLSAAYSAFNNGVAEYGKPVLCIGSNGNGWGISYGPRYYDECGETIDMYLTFWLLGVPGALVQAEYWWNWTNVNLWDTTYSGGDFYKYAYNWVAFECEAGGFDQIISKLNYYDPTISNTSNLFTDLETRLLSQGWSSPGWLNYVAVHATGVDGGGGNSQERLENTIMYWASLLGFYDNMTSTMQSQVQDLLEGTAGAAPAWSLLLQSDLYDKSTGMFKIHSDSADCVEATADAAVLIMLLSTVPVNGAIAVPMEDSCYEDINNVIDGSISSINLTSRSMIVSVASQGTFLSMFGTNIFEYDLNSSGVWRLDFASDWNSLTEETLVSLLPTSRIYLGTVNQSNEEPVYADSDNGSTITPSGVVDVNYGGNQTFNYAAESGYKIDQVHVDNALVQITGTYTFTNVEGPHNISVTSSQTSTVSPTQNPTSPSPNPTSSTPSPSSPSQSSNSTSSSSTPTTKFLLFGSKLILLRLALIFGVSILLAVLLSLHYIKKRTNRAFQVSVALR